MIYTVTLNPAVDKAMYIGAIQPGEVNRFRHSVYSPGGKGINVSRALLRLSIPSEAFYLSGGATGDLFEALVKKELPDTVRIRTSAPTRININLVELEYGRHTQCNDVGEGVTEREIDALYGELLSRLDARSAVVVSGSLPAGVPEDSYARLVASLKERSIFVALDATGPALRRAVEATPTLMKPNRDELSELVGHPLPKKADVIDAAMAYVRQGVREVIVTLGASGSVYLSEDECYRVTGIPVGVLSTVGAGDCFLAGFLKGRTLDDPIRKCLARGLSAATAKVRCEGTAIPPQAELERYLEEAASHISALKL